MYQKTMTWILFLSFSGGLAGCGTNGNNPSLSDAARDLIAYEGEGRGFVPSASCSALLASNLFTTGLYQDLVGRAPSSAEIQATGQIDVNNILARGQQAKKVLATPGSRNVIVARYYRAFLNREPDASGLTTWTNVLAQGGPIEQVIIGLLNSDEYFRASGSTASGFLTNLYRDLLDRGIDPAGKAHWTQVFQSQGRAPVIGGILGSSEYRERGVEKLFSKYLGRKPSSKESTDWVNFSKLGTVDALLANFLSIPEYLNRQLALRNCR